MPNTISVSPAQPNKLVVNGCDLVNRTELSYSQNRELQRYIDANAHLLGFIDKSKGENEESIDNKYGKHLHDISSVQSSPFNSSIVKSNDYDGSSLNRVHSPASSEYRKGVSWSDSGERARSHSPGIVTNGIKFDPLSNAKSHNQNPINDNINSSNRNNANASNYMNVRSYSPAYSTSDKRRTPFDYHQSTELPPHNPNYSSLTRRIESPWANSSMLSRSSLDSQKKRSKDEFKGFKGDPDIPVYSTLERHPDDYNRYETLRYREQTRRSKEIDDSKKFYGFGDHKVSGIELQSHRWTGGEIVSDPNLLKKSLKPRRVYYSPIGDGVVEADGVELKRGPKDMTPRIDIRHQKYVERGSGGQSGCRLIEETWCDGSRRSDNGNKKGRNQHPLNNEKDKDIGYGPFDGNKGENGHPYKKYPISDLFEPNNYVKPQVADNNNNNINPESNLSKTRPLSSGFPTDNEDFPLSGRDSALSIGTNGLPREGWTKTFIVNPRELINQYANETQTIIFDLDDHTPKVTTTIKEVISEAPSRQ